MEHNADSRLNLYRVNNVGEHIYRDYQFVLEQRRTYFPASILKICNYCRITYMFLQKSPYQNSQFAIFQLDGSKVILEVHHLFSYVNIYP